MTQHQPVTEDTDHLQLAEEVCGSCAAVSLTPIQLATITYSLTHPVHGWQYGTVWVVTDLGPPYILLKDKSGEAEDAILSI
jgi:hypothetical protein